MKCPRCGRINGKTNKFCRECGLRLEGLAIKAAAPERAAAPGADEVAVGEALFGVWEVLETGDLDAALERAERVVEANSESAAAHSVLALIYERKAEQEFSATRSEEGRGFLKLAVAHYERIIDLNPDSTADREKLATLRRRVTSGIPAGRWAAPAGGWLEAVLSAVPKPVMIAFGVFLVVLVLLIILVPGGEREPARAESPKRASEAKVVPTFTPNAPSAPPGPSLSVYTYPLTEAAPPSAAANAAQARAQASRPAPGVGPIRVPPLPGSETTIVAERRKPSAPVEKPKPAGEPAEEQPVPKGGKLGIRMLADAVRLHQQGLSEDAVAAAERAIALFQADIDAGRNVDAARRGVENARKLIAVVEESIAARYEEQ